MPNEEIYGVDYSTTGQVASNGDILCVNGLDNARQAIKNALKTPLGSYPSMDDEYGSEIYKILGEDLTSHQKKALVIYIKNSLLREKRVQEIYSIQITLIDGGLKAYMHVLLVNGTEEEIEYNILEDTVNG